MSLRAATPFWLAGLSLAVSLFATLWLHRAADAALARILTERLEGAGRTAGALLEGRAATPELLGRLERDGALELAQVLDASLTVRTDGRGRSGHRANLLRVDAAQVARALAGETAVGFGYAVGEAPLGVGYFPLRDAAGGVDGVLVLEAGEAFVASAQGVRGARDAAVAASVLGALALLGAAVAWARSERARQAAGERAVRAEALGRVAAVAAHEIRNPLGIIRATVELMCERAGAALPEKDAAALADVLAEVERLRRLTEDLSDLAVDRPLAAARVDLAACAREAARATERAHSISVQVAAPEVLEVDGDGGRLRQVLLNLLGNAAQAQGSGTVQLVLRADGSAVRLEVRDQGPGISPQMRARLFEPFATDKPTGTGLGLAVSRRLVERHGGTLTLMENGPGTTFEVCLPAAGRGGAR